MLKETKFYFETLFYDNWDETPIHFAGQEFDGEGVEKWINVTVQPFRNTSNGLSNGSSEYVFTLYIACWADNDVNAMALADDVGTFLNANVDSSYLTNGYDVIDHGWQDSNSVFVIMAYKFKVYGGSC